MGKRGVGLAAVAWLMMSACGADAEVDAGERDAAMIDASTDADPCCPMSSFDDLCESRGGLGGLVGSDGCAWRAFDGVYRRATDEDGCRVWQNVTTNQGSYPSSELWHCRGAAGCCPPASPSELCASGGGSPGGSVPIRGCDTLMSVGGDEDRGVYYLDLGGCPEWVEVSGAEGSYPEDELVRCGEDPDAGAVPDGGPDSDAGVASGGGTGLDADVASDGGGA